jgi:hypothetical protein
VPRSPPESPFYSKFDRKKDPPKKGVIVEHMRSHMILTRVFFDVIRFLGGCRASIIDAEVTLPMSASKKKRAAPKNEYPKKKTKRVKKK